MEGSSTPVTKSAAAKLVKRNFLEALKSNDFGKLKAILIQRQIDVDTVFEVEDENMVLASYKQGKTYRCKCEVNGKQICFQCTMLVTHSKLVTLVV